MDSAGARTLRGLACLLLVLYHVLGSTPAYGLQIASGWLRAVNDTLGAVRMPLFALLAGAVYGWRPGSGLPLLADKARRLLLPALAVGTLFAVAQSLAPDANHGPIDWRLLHVLPVAHYWFLQALFLVFAAVALAERLLPLHRSAGTLTLLALAMLAFLSLPAWPWFGIGGAVYLAPFFVLGMGLTRCGWAARLRQAGATLPVLALGAVSVVWFSVPALADRLEPSLLVSGLLSSLGLWLWAPRWAALGWLGNHSYSVFLYHAFFTGACRMALSALGIDAVAVHVLAGVTAGVAGPIAVAAFVGRHRLLAPALLGRSSDMPRAAVVGTGRERTA